jgi:CheY-like chemotaxis protein/uncharacterized coiled-coil DUF342 family protein
MSQPHKFTEYSEFLPKKERRTPLPITNLPVNAISEDTDPTFEIRNLIEQLQQTSRDARAQVRIAEQERDGLAEELARSQQQIEALRETERELRSHFVEVTSLIQERDEALVEAERRSQALAEANRKNESVVRERNDAQRQRDEAVRHRDEMARKFEAFTRSSEEQARLISETQKQLLTIRQARDGAHAQILDLNNRLGHAEDQIAELEYQRDAAQKAAKQAAAEATEFRRQVDIITTDRDATAKQAEQLSEELDAQRQRYLDLVEQKSAAVQADSEHTAALAEARSQVTGMTQERDAARERAAEVTRELDDLRAQFQAFRDEQARTSDTTLSEAHEKVAALETQARESRHEVNNLRQQLDAMTEQLTALQLAAEQAGSKSDTTREELDTVARERDAALTSLTAAQKQIDHIIRDRDQVRKLATENALELEAQLTSMQNQLNSIQTSSASSEEYKAELAELRQRFEKQRLDTIELSTQFQSSQREIRELSATLAEARLQVKFAQAAARAAQEGRTKSDFASLLAADLAAAETPTAADAAASSKTAPILTEPLTEKEIKSALGAMRHCFQSYTKTPTDLSLLNELHCHVASFAERARVSGLLALHRLCAAFADLTRGLYDIPEQVNPSTLRTVHQTIEFLAAIVKEKNLSQIKDPATALVYAVDDDLGNCESIALAMEESSMRTTYALEPTTALAELASARYDLILLDVNLPGMDGFELCKQIRGLAIHEKTPVVFLTGLATLENRVQSSLSGGNDFIAKPFNLHELSVKAITLLLKNQLQIP